MSFSFSKQEQVQNPYHHDALLEFQSLVYVPYSMPLSIAFPDATFTVRKKKSKTESKDNVMWKIFSSTSSFSIN